MRQTNTRPWERFNAHLTVTFSTTERDPAAADEAPKETRSGTTEKGNRERSERAAAPKRTSRRQRSQRQSPPPAIQTNNKGEVVEYSHMTTKRSRENPVRLTDGKVHPVTVRRIEPSDT